MQHILFKYEKNVQCLKNSCKLKGGTLFPRGFYPSTQGKSTFLYFLFYSIPILITDKFSINIEIIQTLCS